MRCQKNRIGGLQMESTVWLPEKIERAFPSRLREVTNDLLKRMNSATHALLLSSEKALQGGSHAVKLRLGWTHALPILELPCDEWRSLPFSPEQS
jgi:hypothetical protein